VPNARIEGTHSPTKRPWSLFPTTNQRYTESKKDKPAALRNNIFDNRWTAIDEPPA
jgi:hypothetical protein